MSSFKDNILESENSESDSFYVHHFGVTDELWSIIKIEYAGLWKDDDFTGEKQEFEDAFHDTDVFDLRDGYWLRQRSFKMREELGDSARRIVFKDYVRARKG